MSISFILLVVFLSFRPVEKYGEVPWRMSCDHLTFWKKKRGKGRSLSLLGSVAILWQCHRLLWLVRELKTRMQVADNATRGEGQMTTTSSKSGQRTTPRAENITTSWDFVSRWHKVIFRAIGILPYPPPFLFALLNNGTNQVSLLTLSCMNYFIALHCLTLRCSFCRQQECQWLLDGSQQCKRADGGVGEVGQWSRQ